MGVNRAAPGEEERGEEECRAVRVAKEVRRVLGARPARDTAKEVIAHRRSPPTLRRDRGSRPRILPRDGGGADPSR